MPIEARDEVDDSYFNTKIEPICKDAMENIKSKKKKLKEFLTKHRTDFNIRRTLGSKE